VKGQKLRKKPTVKELNSRLCDLEGSYERTVMPLLEFVHRMAQSTDVAFAEYLRSKDELDEFVSHMKKVNQDLSSKDSDKSEEGDDKDDSDRTEDSISDK